MSEFEIRYRLRKFESIRGVMFLTDEERQWLIQYSDMSKDYTTSFRFPPQFYIEEYLKRVE